MNMSVPSNSTTNEFDWHIWLVLLYLPLMMDAIDVLYSIPLRRQFTQPTVLDSQNGTPPVHTLHHRLCPARLDDM